MSKNYTIWSGIAELYDTYRPQPPHILMDMFTQLIHTSRPQLVVDIGCGTGLSTAMWAERAEHVIGIEPNDDMRHQAEKRAAALGVTNIRYQKGLSTETGLSADCADIVTCSQALHWMEPEPTFAEITRILHAGGLFAAYDYEWPPTVQWEVESAYWDLIGRVEKLSIERGLEDDVQYWSKEEHVERMRASGRFRFVKEILMHNIEIGNAERFIGLALSNRAASVLHAGVSEEEMGLAQFRAVVESGIGAEKVPWYLSYRVRIGIK
jgi:ubiquinone/menaquinone biosynthesis C-methylase UbiE